MSVAGKYYWLCKPMLPTPPPLRKAAIMSNTFISVLTFMTLTAWIISWGIPLPIAEHILYLRAVHIPKWEFHQQLCYLTQYMNIFHRLSSSKFTLHPAGNDLFCTLNILPFTTFFFFFTLVSFKAIQSSRHVLQGVKNEIKSKNPLES